MKRKILIMGLPGSGKTTLAKILASQLNAVWFNGNAVRRDIYAELDFSSEDRISHATRMGKLCDSARAGGSYVIADFICRTKETRDAFNADFTIWADRIREGRYAGTNKMFEPPRNADIILQDGTAQEWADAVVRQLDRW